MPIVPRYGKTHGWSLESAVNGIVLIVFDPSFVFPIGIFRML